MKYYIIQNNDFIYAGDVHKDNATGEIKADITTYYKRDSQNANQWEECKNNDLHIDLVIAKEFYKGYVKEYPTLDVAKTIIDRKR